MCFIQSLQLTRVTSCKSDVDGLEGLFYSLFVAYIGLLFFSAIGLTLFTAKAPETIKLDVWITRVALGLSTLVVIIVLTINLSTINVFISATEIIWWGEVARYLLGNVLVASVLFLYQVSWCMHVDITI